MRNSKTIFVLVMVAGCVPACDSGTGGNSLGYSGGTASSLGGYTGSSGGAAQQTGGDSTPAAGQSNCTAGTLGCACYGNQICNASLICQAGLCQACDAGTKGCGCYGNQTCNAGLSCNSNTCVELGGSGGSGNGGNGSLGGETASGSSASVGGDASGGTTSPSLGGTSAAGGLPATGGSSVASFAGGQGTGGAPIVGGTSSTGGSEAVGSETDAHSDDDLPSGVIAAWRSSFVGSDAVEAMAEVLPPPSFGAGIPTPTSGVIVTVDPQTEYQTLEGFGASFLEAGMVNLNHLVNISGQAAADNVMRNLFDPVTGAGFTLMKTVIGGTDFQSGGCLATDACCPDFFTYDDGEADPNLMRFSIARDLEPNGLIPYIRWARAAGGNFQLQAPMDFPPDWMLLYGDPAYTVDPQYYDALAHYYLEYLTAYSAQGIDIDYLSLFNEPGIYSQIAPDELLVLYRDHVAPLIRSERPSTKLTYGEPSSAGVLGNILDDPTVESDRLVDIIFYHGYLSQFASLDDAYAAYGAGTPWSLRFWMTEICCQMYDGDLGDNLFANVASGASGFIYWNMILNEQGGPCAVSPQHHNPDGFTQKGLVHIDATTGEVAYTPEYYTVAHFSKFVRPGAVRVLAVTSQADPNVKALAFHNAGNSVVIVQLKNGADSDREVRVDMNDRWFLSSLPPRSITTLKWSL